jgi:hypothetical protein
MVAVAHNEVHEDEDDEEGGEDDECSHDSDGEDNFDRCRLNNNFGDYAVEDEYDVEEDEDDISMSSEEEEHARVEQYIHSNSNDPTN